MRLNIKSSGRASFLIALIVWFLYAISLYLFDVEILYIIVYSTVAAAILYYVAKEIISRFVIRKLAPIYEIILKSDISFKELAQRFNKNEMFGEVGKDISQWAKIKSDEIVTLKEQENYRREFLGDVSHELKTPLFTVQGYVLTLLDGGLNDPNINIKYLENTNKNIDRLIDIVNELEHISVFENRVESIERSQFDIVELSREVLESLATKAAKRRIKFEVMHKEPIIVSANKRKIEQVLINLVVNSIKYGKRGGQTLIKFEDMYQKVMIEVQDNGIGISEENLPRIFERFYRVDKSRSSSSGGRGLGLSIVKLIVEAHSDKLNVRSELGKGTTFYFTIDRYNKLNQ